MSKRPLSERFWEKVDVRGPDECWPWLAGTSGGYGRIGGDYAHRVCHELVHGPIPAGYDVCHSCDFSRCCNPSHLYAGTHAHNMEAVQEKRRARTREYRQKYAEEKARSQENTLFL